MSQKWAKLFEIDGGQVLFFREPDTEHEDDGYCKLHQIVSLDEATVDMTLRGPERSIEQLFETIAEDNAQRMLSAAKKLLRGGD